MPFKVQDFDPEEESPESRSEIVNAIRSLEPHKVVVIFPAGENTRQQVYTAASRERKAIRTKMTVTGLKVWLKDQPPKAEENVPLDTSDMTPEEIRQAKIAALRGQDIKLLSELIEGENLPKIEKKDEPDRPHFEPDEYSQG